MSAGASAALVALAERLDAPVITTIEGRGSIPEDHRLALGARTDRGTMSGIIGEADVVLAVGTRFQNYATRVWQLRIPGTLIHLDADPGVIGRNYPADIAVVGDARLGLEALAEAMPADRPGTDPGYVERAQKSLLADLEQSRGELGPDHWEICETVRRLLPDDAPIVRDSTVPSYLWGNRVLPILRPRTSIRPSSVAIGPGLPLAVGAAIGSGRRTLLMAGDGGFQLQIGELATVAEYQLPLVVCVFNDGGYGVLRVIQDAVLEQRSGVDLHTPDFVAVAEGHGPRRRGGAGCRQLRGSVRAGTGPTRSDAARHRPRQPRPDAVPAPRPPAPHALARTPARRGRTDGAGGAMAPGIGSAAG